MPNAKTHALIAVGASGLVGLFLPAGCDEGRAIHEMAFPQCRLGGVRVPRRGGQRDALGTLLPPSPFSKPHTDPGAPPMQVFVTGATGYIGFAVSAALRRHGHRVWGLARNDTKAARLARHEIEPVSGDLAHPKSYADVAAHCSVLIH